ncbi:FAD-dependent monooxygenase [Acidipila sp. EB88]|uniref:FAD-dependent monooxygenase n=1 Tax=Acidipila sp. EB88 TaxID=2305226 RepID=UPI000F600704|nr:FAD-dependent monooxygenase [Acidipila sp. EB88]RRA47129.1 FAD-dependent oxidoreductase [Acidipila sp. EB88]
MSEMKPVLIVGAGPTGMTAAMELARFGIPVRIVEKASKPATTSRAVGVQARTLELFEQRGFSAQLVERGNPGVAVSVYGGGKRVFHLQFNTIDSKYQYILFVSQAEAEKALRDALERASVSIDWGTTMVAFSQADHGDHLTAILQGSDGVLEKLGCSYLIASEGAHSNVRETLGFAFEGKSLEEQYALGDFYIDGDLSDSDLHIFSSEHGFMGMFPMGNKRFRIIASNPISKPSKETAPALEELQQLYHQRSPIPATFHDLKWSSWFRINSRMVHQLRSGRIFLGGDSAHIHSPAGAQGMNTGIQDMINLCWKLAMVLKGEAKESILETYAADRIPVIRGVLTKTEGLTHAIGEEKAFFRSVFNHLAPWIVGTEVVQHNSTERMSQLSLHYRESTLSDNHAAAGTLKAGDRVPDISVTLLPVEGSADQNAQLSTLFQLMDPSTFTLLYSNISDPAKTHAEIQGAIGPWHSLMQGHQIAAATNDDSAFKDRFGTSSSIILVRPDGYIAFTGSEHSIPRLAEYCDKWLIAEQPGSEREEHHA